MKTTLTITMLFIVFSAFGSGKKEQPNIIFIMTDQQRFDALHCMGNDAVVSPNIDEIAANGVLFVNGYTSVPSCTPARAGLLTGLSPWHHGMIGYGRVAEKYKYEMPRMLREAGYYTFGVGKMHWFPQKTLHGFNGTLVDESGRVEQDGFISDYRDWFKLNAPGKDPDVTGIGWNEHRAGTYKLVENLHPTYWTGKTAVELIKNYNLDKPLFLKVSFTRPHSPYDPPQRFVDMYKDAKIPEPFIGDWCAGFADRKSGKNSAYGDFGVEHAVNSRKHYYANISFIDEMVGEIIKALKEKEMYENSIICFTSDHGDMLGDHYHWRKTYAYEGSSHIPFIVQWPKNFDAKIKRGSKLENPTELRDFLPTFLDAAGAEIPKDIDGSSLLTLIRDPDASWRPYIDMEHSACYSKDNYWAALTDGNWKYIWFFSTGEEQLFNLKKDPGETVNLAVKNEYKQELATWRKRLAGHLSERGDAFVKDGKPVIRKKSMIYGPNFPKDERSDKERLNEWRKDYKGIDTDLSTVLD